MTSGFSCATSFAFLNKDDPPNIGPALHIHPRGAETFYIIRGNYTFTLENKNIDAKDGDIIVVPKNTPHKFRSGNNGGLPSHQSART